MSLLNRIEAAVAPKIYRLAQPEVTRREAPVEPTGGGVWGPDLAVTVPLAEAAPLPGLRGRLLGGLTWLDETAHRAWSGVKGLFGSGKPADEPVGGGAATTTVRGGDSLSKIAQRELGSSGRWKEIYELNRDQISNPNIIYAGMVLKLPGGASAPAPAPAPAPKPAPAATATVQSGDTLSKLAQRTLGSSGRWKEIYDLNRDQLSNPNVIFPGQVLKLPGGASAPAPAPAPAPQPGNFPLSSAQIASALGVNAGNVAKYWPAIYEAFRKRGMADTPTLIAALATIRVEVGGTFAPISEYASGWAYEGRKDLGNTQSGDGPRFKGRGFIQLTGRANYTTYGKKFGIDLAGNPELALRADVAAEVLAQYFQDRNIDDAARAGDWTTVRKRVNGGTNGWSTFIGAVNSLKAAT